MGSIAIEICLYIGRKINFMSNFMKAVIIYLFLKNNKTKWNWKVVDNGYENSKDRLAISFIIVFDLILFFNFISLKSSVSVWC